MTRSQPRVHRFANLQFQPRFEYGDQAAATQVCGAEDMSELAIRIWSPNQCAVPMDDKI